MNETTKDESLNIGKSFAIAGVTSMMAIVLLAGMSLVTTPALIMRGWVIAKLWGWFVIPYFHATEMPAVIGIGIALLAAVVNPVHVPVNKNDGQSASARYWGAVGFAYLLPPFVLLIAYIVHLWV